MLLKQHSDQSDNRRGMPSASAFHRMMNCEASQPLIDFLRANGSLPQERPDEITEAGNRIHEYLSHLARRMAKPDYVIPEVEGITEDEIEEAETLLGIVVKILKDVFGDLWESDEHHVYVEERFWLGYNGAYISSGKFDLIVHHFPTDTAVILDYKTGWADTPQGDKNWQLTGGAVMVNQDLWATTVHVAIVETHAKIVVSKFDEAAILENAAKLVERIVNAKTADPIRLPYNPTYKNCRYCPAILRCPMANYQTKEAAMGRLTGEVSGDTLEALKGHCDTAIVMEKHVAKEMMARIAEGYEFTDYVLGSSPGKRKIDDPATVCKILLGAGATSDAVFSKVTLAVGEAEKLHKAATGLKGKACTDDFNARFMAYISKSSPAPSIKAR